MGWLNINGNWIGRNSGKKAESWSSYWLTLISATVENAAPTNVVLTFPTTNPALGASDFTVTVNGSAVAVSSASWAGSVITLVLASAVLYSKVVIVTFVRTGGTVTVTNNVAADANAATFITATGVTDAASKAALNELVIDLKAINDTQADFVNFVTPASSILRAVYPFLGSTAASQKWNLIDPQDADASFRLIFENDHEANHTINGYKPNGTDQYADTFLIPSTHLSDFSEHLAIFPTENIDENAFDIGTKGIGSVHYILTKYGDVQYSTLQNETAGNYFAIANLSSIGLFVISRTSAIYCSQFQNGIKTGEIITNHTSTRANTKISIGGCNGRAGLSSKNIGFASIGAGITDAANYLYWLAVYKFLQAI